MKMHKNIKNAGKKYSNAFLFLIPLVISVFSVYYSKQQTVGLKEQLQYMKETIDSEKKEQTHKKNLDKISSLSREARCFFMGYSFSYCYFQSAHIFELESVTKKYRGAIIEANISSVTTLAQSLELDINIDTLMKNQVLTTTHESSMLGVFSPFDLLALTAISKLPIDDFIRIKSGCALANITILSHLAKSSKDKKTVENLDEIMATDIDMLKLFCELSGIPNNDLDKWHELEYSKLNIECEKLFGTITDKYVSEILNSIAISRKQ